jgi:Leucine-rich repeat (LRR) protein
MGRLYDNITRVDELSFKELTCIGEYDAVDIVNQNFINEDAFGVSDILGSEVDKDAFYEHLEQVEGRDKIKHLNICCSSYQRNVEIIRLFPNLQSFGVYGHRIESLDGLECSKDGYKYIDIGTDNRKRNIEKIALVPIESLSLEYSRKEDFDAIKKCTTLEYLTLGGCPDVEFYEWRNVPLEQLKFWNYCMITELRDMSHIPTLTHLMVGACRKFERFSGDNSNIKEVHIDGCRLFDMDSLKTLTEVEIVWIVSCAKKITLSELPEHPTIRKLALWGCKVNIDCYDLKKKMPNLEKLSISNIKKADQELLVKANLGDELFDDFV